MISAFSSSKATTPSLKNSSLNSDSSVRTSSFCAASSSSSHDARYSGSSALRASGAARFRRRFSASSLITSSNGATTGSASFTSMRFIGLEDGGEVPLLQGKHVGLGLFAQAAPHDRAALLVHLEHLLPRGLLVEAEHLFENH